MIVMNRTLASSGRLAMCSDGVGDVLDVHQRLDRDRAVRLRHALRHAGRPFGVSALPMSIWPQAMSYFRPSSDVDLVRPVIACLVAVYGAEFGRGAWAEIEPLLMIRPPRGVLRLHDPERLLGAQERRR